MSTREQRAILGRGGELKGSEGKGREGKGRKGKGRKHQLSKRRYTRDGKSHTRPSGVLKDRPREREQGRGIQVT